MDGLGRRRMVVAVCILVVGLCAAGQSRIIYVSEEATGDFDTIQAAIDDANDSDTILLTPGTYIGDGNRDINFRGKAVTVKSEAGPETCIIDCNGTQEDPHRGFFFQSCEDANSVLQGISITNGFADQGGAILCEASSPTIRDCMVTRCIASAPRDGGLGAGIYCLQSGALVQNCVFSENVAEPEVTLVARQGHGGGVYCAEGNVTIRDCVFNNNSEAWSGAIHCRGGSPRIYRCTIFNETTSAVYCSESLARIESCSFMGQEYGVLCEDGDGTVIEDSAISGNRRAGVMCGYRGGCTLVVRGCTITGNGSFGSYGFGSGLCCDDGSHVTIDNCTITGNADPGVLCLGGSDCTISNSIVWGNRTSPGQIRVNGQALRDTTCSISYSDIQGGEDGINVENRAVLAWGPGNVDADPCFADPGRWEADPNYTGRGTRLFWVEGDYHLKSQAGRWDPNSESWVIDEVTSPCIDAGDPNSPIGLEPFPNSGRINMGAYGGTAEASKSHFGEPLCETIIAGDINGDCKVDFADLVILLNHWHEERIE